MVYFLSETSHSKKICKFIYPSDFYDDETATKLHELA